MTNNEAAKLKIENTRLKNQLSWVWQERDFSKLAQQNLVSHALLVRGDRPVYDEDGEFLGHWQDEKWIGTLLILARELAEIEKSNWRENV